MLKFLLKAWVLTSIFACSLNKQRERHNQNIAAHLQQMDQQIADHKKLMRAGNPFVVQAVSDAIGNNLDVYSAEDINYILSGIYQEFPKEATEIARQIEKYGTPQPRGYGTEYV